MTFTKLIDLIDQEITITRVLGFSFKFWDKTNNRMMVSESYVKGYRKLYQVETDKGQLDLGRGQLGMFLEVCFVNGVADLNGKTFMVKSNGKAGLEIRYFFNLVTASDENDDLGEIPF